MIMPIVISAFLFYLSFPNILCYQGFSAFAWIFAVPLFIAFDQKNILRRLQSGFLFGVFSSLAVVNWMIPYSFLGYLLLVSALTIQAIIFSVLYFPVKKQKIWHMFYVPCAWVTSELMRKTLMMGQSWDLAHSQSFDTALLQWARVLGSSGVSFLLVFVNYLLYWVIFRTRGLWRRIAKVSGVILVIVMIYGCGFYLYGQEQQGRRPLLRIGILQPNIDYRGELTQERVRKIVDELVVLSEQVLKNSRPDLVVWPETAIPADFLTDTALKIKIISLVQRFKVPFLIGAVVDDAQGPHNSAVLLDKQGIVKKTYYKRHLIPLTEYIPSSMFWESLAKIFHVESQGLVPGTAGGLMDIVSKTSKDRLRFGVAICSEDNIGKVFRQYVKEGAGFVIVLLNNGWFSQKEGLVMHAEHSIIRAVENSLPVIRVSNTGLSGFIDRLGCLSTDSLNSLEQRRYFEYEVIPNSQKRTFDNLADTFCLLCFCFVIMTRTAKIIIGLNS